MSKTIKDIQDELILADAHIPTAKISNLLAMDTLAEVTWAIPLAGGSQAWLSDDDAARFIKWFLEGDGGRRTNAARKRQWSDSHRRKFERVWKRALRKARGNLETARLGEIAEVKEAIKEFQELIKRHRTGRLKRLKQKELKVWQAHLKSLTVAEVVPGCAAGQETAAQVEAEAQAESACCSEGSAPPTWRRTSDGRWANLAGQESAGLVQAYRYPHP